MVGEEAFGLACVGDADVGFSASLRITRSLAETISRDQIATAVFVGPFALVGNIRFTPQDGGFSEEAGRACDFNLPRLQSSKALIFLRDKLISIQAEGKDETSMTMERDGRRITLRTQRDLDELSEGVRVPLANARAAIKQLAKACPKLRRQMAEECGSGD
jgi:hypothetical protein